jgi:hypothetical protein
VINLWTTPYHFNPNEVGSMHIILLDDQVIYELFSVDNRYYRSFHVWVFLTKNKQIGFCFNAIIGA